MKKTLLIIGISAALFSCKKQTTKEFAATDLTGNATLKGNLTKKVNVPSGAGFTQINEPAMGVEVSVRIANSALYPNNTNAQGAKNYYGTSDAMGNYAIVAMSNQSGAAATVVIPDMVSTYDTLVNGTRKTGYLAQFVGTTTTKTLVAGTEMNYSYTYPVPTNLSGNPGTLFIGDAWVTGWVTYQTVKAYTSLSGTLTTTGTWSVAAGNTQVWLTYANDPTTGAARNYSVNTDVAGKYTFSVSAASNVSGTATIKFPDYVHTMDTTVFTNASQTTIATPAKTGKAGFYGDFSTTQSSILAKEVRYFNYNYIAFTAF